MAKLKLQLEVTDKGTVVMKDFGNKTKQSMKTATTSTQKYATALKGLVSAYAALKLVQLAKDWARLYMVQESAENALGVAMKNAQTYTKANHDMMLEYAAALQKTTTYGDEVTISTMANLQAYGMTTAELKRATVATMDLATAKKIDLRAASELVGKAFVGETGTLSRYGIVLEKGIEKSKKFEAVLGLIGQRFGGAATAELNTYAGTWAQFGNTMGDIGEDLGKMALVLMDKVLPSLKWTATQIKVIVDYWSKVLTGEKEWTVSVGKRGRPGQEKPWQLGYKPPGTGAPTEDEKAKKLIVGTGYDYELSRMQGMVTEEEKFRQMRLQMDQENFEARKKLNDEYWAENMHHLEENEAEMEAYHERAQAREEARVTMAKYAAATMMGNWAYFFQYLSTQNDAWFKVFKAFAIAEATINTYIAATKALAQLGPIMGPIAAAAMIAKGLAMVAQISSMSPGGGAGGGGGGAMGTYPASETTGLPAIGAQERGALTIHIAGDFYGDEAFVDMLADRINAAVEERDVRLVSSETR